MRNILVLLAILFVIGILWLSSKFWEFSEEKYVNSQIVEKTQLFESTDLDIEFLKQEFRPAYEL